MNDLSLEYEVANCGLERRRFTMGAQGIGNIDHVLWEGYMSFTQTFHSMVLCFDFKLFLFIWSCDAIYNTQITNIIFWFLFVYLNIDINNQ